MKARRNKKAKGIASLEPDQTSAAISPEQAIEGLFVIRKKARGRVNIRELIEDGRR